MRGKLRRGFPGVLTGVALRYDPDQRGCRLRVPMDLSRRSVVLGLSASALAGCASGQAPVAAVADTLPTAPNPGWDAWVEGFRGRAVGSGISASVFDRAFSVAGFVPGVVERDRNQTERVRTLEDYLAIVADDARIGEGRSRFAQYGGLLEQLESRFGVEAKVLTSIWGVESRYGTRRGSIPVISATSTLAFDGRRGAFFERQLLAALRIQQNGDIGPRDMTGSWAGAMGHTQFIPTTYEAYAIDFRGDGRRDIWADDPTDALASAANYLAESGWRRGQPWGVEVQLPEGFDYGLTGRGNGRNPDSWASLGVRDMNGRAVPNHGTGSIILPMGASGPAFMIFANYTVLSRYNNSQNYIIAVGYLADRIAGGPPIRAGFPPDAQGLRLEERQEIQRRLAQAGYDPGDADGVIGDRTIAAIRAWQTANGQPVTGLATRDLLESLR